MNDEDFVSVETPRIEAPVEGLVVVEKASETIPRIPPQFPHNTSYDRISNHPGKSFLTITKTLLWPILRLTLFNILEKLKSRNIDRQDFTTSLLTEISGPVQGLHEARRSPGWIKTVNLLIREISENNSFLSK